MKEKWTKVANLYLIIFALIMMVYCSVNVPQPTGEWDDYSLPVASILNDHNFGISDEDVELYKNIFREWANYIDSRSLSGYIEKNGGEMTWYFPIYAIVCIPAVLVLQFMELPAIYAFPYTNLALLIISLGIVFRVLKIGEKRKLALIVLLSANPIVFYTGWTSAEVFIYSVMITALAFWYNRYYFRAAIFISIAGMLNPTIMSIGFVMIFEYMLNILSNKNKNQSWREFVKENILRVVAYGCCYIIGLIPMLYNFWNTGYINLTVSYDNFVMGKETVIKRFFSYLFDLNYGILPYFFVITILAIVLTFLSIIRRKWRFLEWIIAFVINVICYSFMIHINCGMAGIARYNAWSVTLIIFAVCLFFDELCMSIFTKRAMRILLCLGAMLTGLIVLNYGPYLASNTSCWNMMPIASVVLEKAPLLYNPLHSTFNSRSEHIDGGYIYETPIFYIADDGFVRKILASNKDAEELRKICSSASGNQKWLEEKIDRLNDKESYISIPEKYKVILTPVYDLGTPLIFHTEGYNVKGFASKGLSHSEEWGSWTEGTEFELHFRTQSNCKVIRAEIECGVYNNEQDIEVFVNDTSVYRNESFKGGKVIFDFNNPGYMDAVIIKIKIPNAISPSEFGYADKRILGLGIREIVFFDASERASYQLGEIIYFDSYNNNADKYIIRGINGAEEWGSWTEGNEFEMQFSTKSNSEKILADIYCGVYNKEQDVIVYINDQEIKRWENFEGGVLQFDFCNPGIDELIKVNIVIPNAISPTEFGFSDTRVLGLGISKMIFTEDDLY